MKKLVKPLALLGVVLIPFISSSSETACVSSSNPSENIGVCIESASGGGDVCQILGVGITGCMRTIIVIGQK